MSNEIKRATGLLIIEAVNSNPNGDPDRESDPRQRPNGQGEISPVSFKRKLRDLVAEHDAPFFKNLPQKFSGNPERYCILESRGRERKEIQKEMGDKFAVRLHDKPKAPCPRFSLLERLLCSYSYAVQC